jgi:hypothetical protein
LTISCLHLTTCRLARRWRTSEREAVLHSGRQQRKCWSNCMNL